MRWAAARILNCAGKDRTRNSSDRRGQDENILIGSTHWRGACLILACSILICCAAILVRSSGPPVQEKTAATKKTGSSNSGTADAYRLNTLGVAFEAATQQLPKDAYAWYNLGLVYKDLGEAEKGIAAF